MISARVKLFISNLTSVELSVAAWLRGLSGLALDKNVEEGISASQSSPSTLPSLRSCAWGELSGTLCEVGTASFAGHVCEGSGLKLTGMKPSKSSSCSVFSHILNYFSEQILYFITLKFTKWNFTHNNVDSNVNV